VEDESNTQLQLRMRRDANECQVQCLENATTTCNSSKFGNWLLWVVL